MQVAPCAALTLRAARADSAQRHVPYVVVSVSHTTRKPRAHEIDGRDYNFVAQAQFQELVGQAAFLEHARVFDNFYGTGAAQVHARLAQGHDVVLEIDWQGAQLVRRTMPECVTIFILPPSRAALQQRLQERRTDSAEAIARRLRDAVTDMSHCHEFDYVVINDRFDQAALDLVAILDGHGEALRADRPQLQPLLGSLLG